MYSIDKEITSECIINKSRFITKLFFVVNKDIEEILNKLKNEYKDATHYCYAYVINNEYKVNDNGEPNGTAGLPILNVLTKNNLNNVLCVVIRYFGGVKLGTGGLIRAYTNSVTKALKGNIVKYVNAYKIRFSFNYEDSLKIDFLLKKCNIVYKEFNKNVIYEVIIDKYYYEKIKDELVNCVILEETYIKEK